MSAKREIPHTVDEIEKKFMEFQRENEPNAARASKLDGYKRFIKALHEDNYSHDQISAFLQMLGVKAHSTTVGRFIRNKIYTTDNSNQGHSPALLQSKTNEENVATKHPQLSRPTEKKLVYTPYSENQDK